MERAGLLKLLLQPENSIRYTAKEKSQTLFTKFKRMQIFISLFPGLIISYSCVLLIKMNVIFMRLNATSRIGVSDNKKNDALVELTLPKNANIYASAYQLYLPDKALLQAKVKEWIAEFEENEELMKHE